jgi:C4-dicarboxylate-specific signal transduction histidine kinase
MRVLVADDDQISLRVLEKSVAGWNYEVVLAKDGKEAWDILSRPPLPSIALLDWIMPGPDGLELCRRLRNQKNAKFIYIILVTSNDRPEDITTGLDAGADDYITKPFNKAELKSRIASGRRVVEYENSLKQINEELRRYSLDMEILAQERAQQLVQADRMISLGTMAAGITHEINNPLTILQGNTILLNKIWQTSGIKNLAESLKPTGDNTDASHLFPNISEIIEALQNGVRRIRKIVDGMRIFSHGQGGKIEQIDLRACLHDAIQICLSRTKYLGGVKTKVEEIPFSVKGNPVQITQVLVNFIANAADALASTPKPVLNILLRPSSRQALFTIQDNGPGIAHENINQLWSPSFTTKPVGKGTGLGLAICHNIIAGHGGDIKVNSKLGVGTTFTVQLPDAEEYDRIMEIREKIQKE